MVIHEPYHFQFPNNVLPLPSLVKQHEKANPDSDERVRQDCDQQSLRVLVEPEIRQTSKKEDAKASKDAPQRSNPTGTCTSSHGRILPSLAKFVFAEKMPSVITSKAANGYHFKTGQRDWPSRTENVLTCRLLWWQVGFGSPAPRAALEHVSVVQ
jgi:hypothetical protein